MKVGIETDRGSWVAALVAAGYEVFAVNPLSVARYRERHSTSGAKSDAADAHLLAEMVRLDGQVLPGGVRRVILRGSGGDGLQFVHLLGVGGGFGGGAAAGQEVESEVAAAFGPFVVLLGQDGADQSDD